MRRNIAILATVIGILLFQSGASRAADVVIGIPSWSSANATAHLIKEILEKRLKLEVGVVEATNEEIFAGMDKGTIHVHPEVWLPNQIALHDKYVIGRKSVVMSDKAVPAAQGVCVTKQTAEGASIRTIQDLTDAEKVKVFDTNGDGLGELWIGDASWTSTRIEKVRAKSYGYNKTMQLLEASETVAMAAVDAAVAVDRPIAFYCYAPHHVFALHEIVFLDEPPHDPRHWKIVNPEADPDWLANSDAKVAWATSFLHVTYAKALEDSNPEAARMLSSITLDVDTVSAMTYAIVVDGIDPADFAQRWAADNSARIDEWLGRK
jgi:glycine betaine/proline transport system substrate-binding protein